MTILLNATDIGAYPFVLRSIRIIAIEGTTLTGMVALGALAAGFEPGVAVRLVGFSVAAGFIVHMPGLVAPNRRSSAGSAADITTAT